MPDLKTVVTARMAAAIAGKSQATSGRMFTTEDHSGAGTYVRNPQFWIPAALLTAYGVSNSVGGTDMGFFAVSPDCVTMAKHYAFGQGAVGRWVTEAGAPVDRAVSDFRAIAGTDIAVARLSSPLPASIGFFKVVPSTLPDKITSGTPVRVPMIGLLSGSDDDPYHVATYRDLWGRGGSNFSYTQPLDAKALEFYYDALESGDSGDGSFLWAADGELLACGHWWGGGGGSGPWLHAYKNAVNAAMASMGSPYTLTEGSLDAYDDYPVGGTPADPPPTIGYFYPASNSVPAGQTTTLHWSVTGPVASVTLYPPGDIVAASGSRVVGAGSYTLTASGAGGTVDDSVQVREAGSGVIYYFNNSVEDWNLNDVNNWTPNGLPGPDDTVINLSEITFSSPVQFVGTCLAGTVYYAWSSDFQTLLVNGGDWHGDFVPHPDNNDGAAFSCYLVVGAGAIIRGDVKGTSSTGEIIVAIQTYANGGTFYGSNIEMYECQDSGGTPPSVFMPGTNVVALGNGIANADFRGTVTGNCNALGSSTFRSGSSAILGNNDSFFSAANLTIEQGAAVELTGGSQFDGGGTIAGDLSFYTSYDGTAETILTPTGRVTINGGFFNPTLFSQLKGRVSGTTSNGQPVTLYAPTAAGVAPSDKVQLGTTNLGTAGTLNTAALQAAAEAAGAAAQLAADRVAVAASADRVSKGVVLLGTVQGTGIITAADFVALLGDVSVAVTVAPIAATATRTLYDVDTLTVAQGSAASFAWTIVDALGAPVDLTGRTVRFVAGKVDHPTLVGLYAYESGTANLTVTGADGNVVTVTHATADTATPRTLVGWLWNITDEYPLRKVKLTVEPAYKAA